MPNYTIIYYAKGNENKARAKIEGLHQLAEFLFPDRIQEVRYLNNSKRTEFYISLGQLGPDWVTRPGYTRWFGAECCINCFIDKELSEEDINTYIKPYCSNFDKAIYY